jgi:hypothetical protein
MVGGRARLIKAIKTVLVRLFSTESFIFFMI